MTKYFNIPEQWLNHGHLEHDVDRKCSTYQFITDPLSPFSFLFVSHEKQNILFMYQIFGVYI